MSASDSLTSTQNDGLHLGVSECLGAESRAALRWFAESLAEAAENTSQSDSLLSSNSRNRNPAIRKKLARAFRESELCRQLLEHYPAEWRLETIGGVPCEVFAPAGAVAEQTQSGLLINLHGGEFMHGAGINSLLESMPIAAIGSLPVISIDYRLAPEHRFPVATEDVLAVYRALLEDHEAKSLGVYGSSAGALLAAQFLARLPQEDLPPPAAAGMLFGAAGYWYSGDSGRIARARTGGLKPGPETEPYFESVDPHDPSAFPIHSREFLASFPPTVLISSTRDFALSSVVHTHSRLLSLGVESELHVWEGLDHVFQYNPKLPESREVYQALVRFFSTHLVFG